MTGALNYLLVRPVNGSRSLELRHAELVSLEGSVLRTVQLGPPGPDGVQRGGPLRPPDRQLFRVKVRSVGSWGVWGGVVVGMGLREGVKGRFGANGLSSCQFTGMSAPTTGKFVLCFNCIAFVNVFLCWFCHLPISCHDFLVTFLSRY